MERYAENLVRLLKRLKAAVGYHELGMTEHALRCLDSLAGLGKIGEFRLVEEVLRGEFLRAAADHLSAASALEVAESLAPHAARRAIRMTLAACFGNPCEAETRRGAAPSLAAASR